MPPFGHRNIYPLNVKIKIDNMCKNNIHTFQKYIIIRFNKHFPRDPFSVGNHTGLGIIPQLRKNSQSFRFLVMKKP